MEKFPLQDKVVVNANNALTHTHCVSPNSPHQDCYEKSQIPLNFMGH